MSEPTSELFSSGPTKILIVRLSSFGDIIHAIPAQQCISELRPDTELHWLVEPPLDKFLARVQGIRQVWVADTKSWRRRLSPPTIYDLVKRLRRQRFDLAIDFQGLVKSALLARLSGARQVIGFRASDVRERPAAWLYSHTGSRVENAVHRIEANFRLLRTLGLEGKAQAGIQLEIPDDAFEEIDRALSHFAALDPVVLNLGGGWKTKVWAPSRFAQLATEIESRMSLPVVFTYGPGEEYLLEEVRRETASQRVKAIPTDFFQLAALCRRARLMVAGDTGPMHLAVALGTPVVAILGPALPSRTGPFSRDDLVVQHVRPCPHPYRRTCHRHYCMDIPVGQVLEAVRLRLQTRLEASDCEPAAGIAGVGPV